jgi:SAM-dependent methyltransferase
MSSGVPAPEASGPGRPAALVFGEVADLYDTYRPGYPDSVFAAVLEGTAVPASVIEIGAGTGIATESFVRAGARVVAIEPDARMAAVGRQRCAGLGPGAAVFVPARFEDLAPAPVGVPPIGEVRPGALDIVAAAQSWHWHEDHVEALARSREWLRADGVLALFWNTPRDNEAYDALRGVYARVVPQLVEGMAVASWESEMGMHRDRVADAEGFDAPEVSAHDFAVVYDGDALCGLVQTYSGHRLLAPEVLGALCDAVRAMVAAAGGSVTLAYRTVLITARRRA